MLKKSESYFRAINNKKESYNILTFPTHESYWSNHANTQHNYFLFLANGIKTWNSTFRRLPKNHMVLDGSDNQIKLDMKFDLVLSQNKFGQFQIANSIASSLNLPLVSIEHTLPVPEWNKFQRQQLTNMRGNLNVFISEYSVGEWGYSLEDPSVRIIHHGLDTEKFKPKENGHSDGKVLTVVNDWVNRNWCMPKGQKILTNNGYKNIDKIEVGDIVLTSGGQNNYVTKTFKRQYFGPMVSIWIDNKKEPLLFTSDHAIKVVRDNQEKYIEASRLRKDDSLVFPSHVKTSFYNEDTDLSWIIGLIIGDGSITNSGNIEIVFKQSDRDIAEKACRILERITGNKASISDRERKRNKDSFVLKVTCSSKIFSTWLKDRINGKSYNKSIPDFIFNGSSEQRLSVLKGLWFCDGSFKNGKKHGVRACYSTISGKLASQINSMLNSFGVGSYIRLEKRTTNKSNGNIVPIYRVNSYGENFNKCKNLIENDIIEKPYSYTIRDVKIDFEWSGMVYNCEVSKDPSYVVYPGFVAHNCCGWDIYTRTSRGLPVNPLGDTKGFSLPAKNTDDLISNYQNASVFLNTSIISPVPTALLEAMSCGCPVVTTATCMIPEIIKDGINGFISNDEEYLREKLVWCLENPDKAKEIGKNARATIEEKFGLFSHLNKWHEIFKEVYGRGYRPQ